MKKVKTPKRPSAKAATAKATAVSKAEDMLLNAIIVNEGTDKDSPFYKKPITTSLLVAKKFGKEHKDVLEVIRNLTAENSAVKSFFVENQYINDRGKQYPMYVMNFSGFTLLAMGFTGQQALQFKLDYIAEFNRRGDMIIGDVLNKNNLLLERFSAENEDLREKNKDLQEFKDNSVTMDYGFDEAARCFHKIYSTYHANTAEDTYEFKCLKSVADLFQDKVVEREAKQEHCAALPAASNL